MSYERIMGIITSKVTPKLDAAFNHQLGCWNINLKNSTTYYSCANMNLFLLSLDRKQCVQWYADKHIVKMILELAQLLYGVWGVLEDPTWRNYAPTGSYKTTHVNHPIAIWMRQSTENYKFAASYAYPMLEEYTRRYGKIHGCQRHIDWLVTNIPPNLPDGPLTQLPQAMPDEYKVNNGYGNMDDTVRAYRNYYIGFKVKNIQITYTNTEWPEWLPRQDPQQFKLYKEQQKLLKQRKNHIGPAILPVPTQTPIFLTLHVLSPNSPKPLTLLVYNK